MYDLRLFEFIAKICDKKLYQDIALYTWDIFKYFIGYSKNFRKLKTKDAVVIRYTDWKKRSFDHRKTDNLSTIQIPKSWFDLDNPETISNDYIANRHKTKQLQKNEEIVGMVLKFWNGERKRYYPSDFANPEILTKFNAVAILGGDTIYVVYDIDWLQGIEIVTQETENMTLIKKIKWFF